ncbi:MAG: M23 family metallopeptidase [Pseudonocardiaceae bacterium]
MDVSQRTGLIGYDTHPSLRETSKCYGINFRELWYAGEDWFTSSGTPIRAVADGKVVCVSPADYKYPGSVIIIEHQLAGGGKIWSMYGHIQKNLITVSVETVVQKGQTISNGLHRQTYRGVNNTHLHWEMRNFYDGSGINKAPHYSKSCSGVPGPGYTYPAHPDNFVANNGEGPTYSWTDPSAFVSSH